MRLTSLLAATALMIGGVSICGCQSSESQPSQQNSGQQNPGFAGGNGAFGENPVNPGEHSEQRFNTPPATQPAGQ